MGIGQCRFRRGGELVEFDTPFYERDRLPVDTPIDGPAIIVQLDSTTVIPPDCSGVAHTAGHLLIQIGESA